MYRYVPVLRLKRGERVGIHQLTQPGRVDVWPLFRLSPDRYVGKKQTKAHPAIPPAAFVALELFRSWGTNPFFVDTSLVPYTGSASQNPLVRIATAARASGMSLVPATRLAANQQYQQAVAAVEGADHRGVGLQVDLSEMTSAASWVSSWSYPMSQTHLLVDLAGDVKNVAALGQAVVTAFSSSIRGTAGPP